MLSDVQGQQFDFFWRLTQVCTSQLLLVKLICRRKLRVNVQSPDDVQEKNKGFVTVSVHVGENKRQTVLVGLRGPVGVAGRMTSIPSKTGFTSDNTRTILCGVFNLCKCGFRPGTVSTPSTPEIRG